MRRFYISLFVALNAAFGFQSAIAQTLTQALDAGNLTWTTGGTGGGAGWFGESSVTHDGVDAAQSGTVNPPNQTSVLQTTVTGPGTLSFWWYVPSSISGSLVVKVANSTQATYPGTTNWLQQTVYIGPGTQTVQWIFSNPTIFSTSGYVDQVSWVTGTTAPIITNEPVSQSQVQGLNNTFAVSVVGTPPLSYQWHFNDVDIPGATNSSLIVSNVQSTNLGLYSVTITNVAGPTNSTDASLEFGNVTGWGSSAFSQIYVPLGATNILGIAAGWQQSLALKADGSVLAWGGNSLGQEIPPTNLPPPIAISANRDNSLALQSNGTVVEWGDNSFNQTNTAAALSDVVALAPVGSAEHALALHPDGTVTAWGLNSAGQTNVPAGFSNIVAVAAGTLHSVALRSDGTVIAWGSNFSGQTNVPPDLTNAVAVAAGQLNSFALRSDGTIAVWGGNSFGLTNIPPGLTNVVSIQAGDAHCLALKADGTVVAWGLNSDGETNVPPGLSNVVAIAAGYFHNLALVGNGPPIMSAPIQNPILSSNGFSFSLPSQSGRVYALEYKNSLTDTSWTALPLVAGNGTSLTFVDSTATNSQQRFYRVRRW